MNVSKILLLSLILLAIVCPAYPGKFAGSFLEIGVGARPLGMGGAYVAVANDGTAFYWNPAGLALVEKPEITFMYSTNFGGITDPLANYNHAGFALPLPGDATLSINWIRLSVDDIPQFPELAGDNLADRLRDPALRPNGVPVGLFGDTEDAFFFSFAKLNKFRVNLGWQYLSFPVEIPIGINLKVIQQKLFEDKASGLGIDVGAMIRFGIGEMLDSDHLGKLGFGFNIQDISKTNLTWTSRHQDQIPVNLKWGFSYSQPIGLMNSELLFSYGKDTRYGGESHWGVEYSLKTVFFRLGSNDGSFTAGTGFHLWKVRLDYAFLGYDLGNVHRLSGAFQL
ncbi:MAG: hypothetical protein ACE5HO_14075 [bacterium]